MQKDSDDVSKRNENEFINNILLISSDINETNKISCYTLLSYINYEKERIIYLYRTTYVLEKEKNIFYSYECK